MIESNRPIAHVARDLGIPSETLHKYVRQVEADEGLRPDLPTAAEREQIRKLRAENSELRRANEVLKAAVSESSRVLWCTGMKMSVESLVSGPGRCFGAPGRGLWEKAGRVGRCLL